MDFFIKIFFLLSLAVSIHASQKTSVLIIHSYSQEYLWTKGQHNSFVSTLQKSGKNFDLSTEYLDTKKLNFTPEYQNEFLRYIKIKYKNRVPNLIYVTDDNALKFVFNNHNEFLKNQKTIPVFFSGVNDLNMHKLLPKNNFAGVYEIKIIKQNIELIKQFSPQTRDIWFIGDNSETYYSIKKEIQHQQKNFNNMNFHYLSDKNISKIIEQLPKDKRSFIILTTIGNLKDDKNHVLLPKESIDIIDENNNLIILSMEDAYMSKGVVGGYVTSATEQGKEAAKLVLKYIDKKSFDNISSLLNSPNVYMFNSKELTNSRVILSEYIARNSTIINKDKSFTDKNKGLLLSVLSVFIFVLIFGFIIVYILQIKKYTVLLEEFKKLKNIDSKLDEE
ncbi:ABC transporter substrate-binding protein [Sulfurimonas sp.]